MTEELSLRDRLVETAASIQSTEVAAFSIHSNNSNLEIDLLVHIRPDEPDPETRKAAVEAFRTILKPCVEQQKNGVIEIDDTPNPAGTMFCLVALVTDEKETTVGAAAYIVRCADLEDGKTLLRRVEIALHGKPQWW